MIAATLIMLMWLAFSNGSNDNFKGVATLYGSGGMSYRSALCWATVTVACGALTALYTGSGLLSRFTGKGLVPDDLVATPSFALSVGIAAAGTVILATRLGLPVSTTHALMGALLGAGLASAPGDVAFAALGKSFLLPLILSPILALLLTSAIYVVAARARGASGVRAESCVCVEAMSLETANTSAVAVTSVVVSKEGCATGAPVVTARTALDVLHVISGGVVGFARGLNDAPKITALAGTAAAISRTNAAVLVAVAMAVGGLIGARRVAEKMSHGITGMNEGQGFSANLVTSGLVLAASWAALPVSTTHVSVGSLFGIGATRGDARKAAIISILLAWLATMPIALALAWTTKRVLG